MTDYDRILRDFTKAINQVKAEYRFYTDKVVELDKATQDILHQLELGDRLERSKWTTKLVQTRKERRYAKDALTITEHSNILQDKINELVSAVNRQDKEIKELKETTKNEIR